MKHQQENRRLGIQYELANKRSLCQYQQNITNNRSNFELSKLFNKTEKKAELDKNKVLNRQ